jgi:tetratricopeptide (TPR) repeat protein/transcriptional regulator with XRE-family HTH domain
LDGAAGTGLGALLRRQRLAAGLSQEELADRSGLSVRTISKIEGGETRHPYRPSVQALADALQLPAAERDQLMRLSRGVPGDAGRSVRPEDHPPVVRHALPPDVAAFSGRASELSIITAALPDPGQPGPDRDAIAVLAIGGMPGVGKTTLAVHAAHLLADRFPDRQLFVDLHGHTPGRDPLAPEEALASLLTATGVSARDVPADLAGRTSLWRDKLAGQRALLVFDNAASSAQVAPLLPGSGGCLVLVTSRRHLADLPAAVVQVPVEELPPDAAWDMFARLAPRAVGHPDAIAELVSLAGGLPLAISLLARVSNRHPTWTLSELAAETRRDMLTLTAEHASVAAAFGLSWRSLQPGWQEFLAALGLHPGPSTDAYGAAALSGLPLAEATELLDRLHGEGLLTETSYRRYGMHDLIRRFAADRAAQIMTAAQRTAAAARLADYLQYAAGMANDLVRPLDRGARMPVAVPAAGPALDSDEKALAWLRAERPVLLALLDQATAAGNQRPVIDLTAALSLILERDGPWADAIERYAIAARAARDTGNLAGLADASLHLGSVQRLAGEWDIAAGHLGVALTTYRDLGNRSGQAIALRYLSDARRFTGDYVAAERCLRQALDIHRDLGDQHGLATTLTALADLQRMMGDLQSARTVLAEALRVHDQAGDRAGLGISLMYLAVVLTATGEYRLAVEALDEAEAVRRELGRPIDLANISATRGSLLRLTGDLAGADRALTVALAMFREIGQRLGEASCLRDLGGLRSVAGDLATATALINQAIDLFRTVNSPYGVASSRVELGRVKLRAQDHRSAAQNLAAALATFQDAGNRADEPEARNLLGELHRRLGDLGQARECHQQALDLAVSMTLPLEEARALAGLGRCAIAAGDRAAGAAQLGQAAWILTRIGNAEATAIGAELAELAAGPVSSADD